MIKTYIRNFLTLIGIYYLSWWVGSPIFMIYTQLTAGITYGGSIFGYLLMGIVSAVPVALAAFGGGIMTAYVLNDSHFIYWLALLALFYAVNGFFGFHWAKEPQLSDRAFQIVQVILPALSCYVGGTIIDKLICGKLKTTLNNSIEADRE